MQNGNNQDAFELKAASIRYAHDCGFTHMESVSLSKANDALCGAFAAGAAWQKARDDAENRLGDNEGGYRLEMMDDGGPSVVHSFGNPEAMRELRELFKSDPPAIDAVMEAVAGLVTRQQATMATLDTMGGNIALIMKQNGDHGGIVGKIWANSKEAIDRLQASIDKSWAAVDRGLRDINDTMVVNDDAAQLARMEEKIEGLHPRFDLLGGRISRKAMEVTAAILPVLKDVGQKVEAVGFMVADEVEYSGTTEPMHAEVKAEPTSGLGKMWRDVPVDLADVSDETLDDLHRSGQISTARYIEERGDRQAAAAKGTYHLDRGTLHVGVDLAKPPVSDQADAMACTIDGLKLKQGDMGATSEGFQVWSSGTGMILVAYRGKLYSLNGRQLIPIEIVA